MPARSDVRLGTAPVPTTVDRTGRSRWIMRRTAAQWYAVAVGAFLTIRGASTLIAGASFARPGDGWRAVFQLCITVVLVLSLRSRTGVAKAVLGIGIVYVVVTVLGLINGHDILGVIPVDTRDKIVHPLLAVAALLVGFVERRRFAAAARA